MTKKSSKKQTLVDTGKELNEKRVYKTGLLMESEVPSSLLLMAPLLLSHFHSVFAFLPMPTTALQFTLGQRLSSSTLDTLAKAFLAIDFSGRLSTVPVPGDTLS